MAQRVCTFYAAVNPNLKSKVTAFCVVRFPNRHVVHVIHRHLPFRWGAVSFHLKLSGSISVLQLNYWVTGCFCRQPEEWEKMRKKPQLAMRKTQNRLGEKESLVKENCDRKEDAREHERKWTPERAEDPQPQLNTRCPGTMQPKAEPHAMFTCSPCPTAARTRLLMPEGPRACQSSPRTHSSTHSPHKPPWSKTLPLLLPLRGAGNFT